jgi:hypothetical protein
MAESIHQTFANHTKLDPAYHLFVVPVAAVNLGVTIWNLIRNPGLGTAWYVVLAIAACIALLKLRLYALKVQDRVIRLEERLRLAQLLPEPLRSRIGDLTEAQFIGLRFASDAEVAPLVEKALSGMTRGEIKKAISNWRPDYFRV